MPVYSSNILDPISIFRQEYTVLNKFYYLKNKMYCKNWEHAYKSIEVFQILKWFRTYSKSLHEAYSTVYEII